MDYELSARPSLAEIRSKVYWAHAPHASGVTHTRAWDSKGNPANALRTLRLSSDYVEHLRRKRGPKGRRSRRDSSIAPGLSYGQRGRLPGRLPHQLRSEMNRIFQAELAFGVRMLVASEGYRPNKRVRINLVMPDLSLATSELHSALLAERPVLEHHPAFQRMWLPCIARLLEIRWRFTHSEVDS
jgi:hypothetical protein